MVCVCVGGGGVGGVNERYIMLGGCTVRVIHSRTKKRIQQHKIHRFKKMYCKRYNFLMSYITILGGGWWLKKVLDTTGFFTTANLL